MLSTELTTNRAGGTAYSLTAQGQLAQYTVTGMLGNLSLSNQNQKTEKLVELASQCSSEFIAKTAVYARQLGFIQDAPVVLVAYLSTRDDKEWFYTAFNHTIDNIGMLRKFISIIRSGAVGRKSLGTAAKKAIQNFFNHRDADKLFWQATGTNPTIGDVLRLAHPKPNDPEKDALFGYFLEKEVDFDALPKKVRAFESFKKGDQEIVPDVPFHRLTSLNLSTDQWEEVFRKMTWNQLRKQLVTAQRRGLIDRPRFVRWAAAKLADPEQVRRQRVLPFSLLPTIAMAKEAQLPEAIVQSLETALELTLANAPKFDANITVLVDTSGSMSRGMTSAHRGQTARNSPSRITFIQVASIFASALLAANPENCHIIPFDTRVHPANDITSRNSLTENTMRLGQYGGGGTSISCGFEHLIKTNNYPDIVVIISDNESWIDSQNIWRNTATLAYWNQIKEQNPNAKLICHNIDEGLTTQAPDRQDILNIGGWSDTVFSVMDMFVKAPTPEDWSAMINNMQL